MQGYDSEASRRPSDPSTLADWLDANERGTPVTSKEWGRIWLKVLPLLIAMGAYGIAWWKGWLG